MENKTSKHTMRGDSQHLGSQFWIFTTVIQLEETSQHEQLILYPFALLRNRVSARGSEPFMVTEARADLTQSFREQGTLAVRIIFFLIQ